MTTLERFNEACEIRAVPAIYALDDFRLRVTVKLARFCDWQAEVDALFAATPKERCKMLAERFLDPNTGERLFDAEGLYAAPARAVETLLRLYIAVNTATYKDPDEEEE